jgi:lactoylglutathione lyase
MDHSRYRRYDAIHIWKDIGRQVGLYVNRISDSGSSDSLGGFETITSDCGGECVKIEHVAMYVNDLEKARDFFVKYLNGKSNDLYHNKKTDFRSYFITFEDGARLEIMNKPDMVDAEKHLNRTGLIHIAFSVGSKERVDEITQLLQTDGYHIVSGPRTTGDGYYESCVAAIENNQIEFTV